MKVIAINGSPRKGWNTETLLKKALEGAGAAGAETEMVHLYDLKFRGCVSCMACKLKKEPRPCRCILRDEQSVTSLCFFEKDVRAAEKKRIDKPYLYEL